MTEQHTALEDFRLYHQALGHSQHTINHYQQSLAHLPAKPLSQITRADLRALTVGLLEGRSPRTVHGIMSDLKAFFAFLEAEGYIDSSPMKQMKLPKVPQRVLPAFSKEDIQKLLKAADLREQAMVMVLLDTGIRLSELCQMTTKDIDPASHSFRIIGKGNRERTCYLSPPTIRVALKYMRQWQIQGPLWTGTKGKLTRFGVAQVLSKLGSRAGVHTHPHKFRRTAALTMLRSGANIFSVQNLLGHSDLTVLKQYLAQDARDFREAHQRHSPVMALV